MGYFLTTITSSRKGMAGESLASPKTHTPGARVSNLGQRFYGPGLGRWLSRDPIGERDGASMFVYCRNGPSEYIDALGLKTKKCCVTYFKVWLDYQDGNGLATGEYGEGGISIRGHHRIYMTATNADPPKDPDCDCDCTCCVPSQEIRGWYKDNARGPKKWQKRENGQWIPISSWTHETIADKIPKDPCAFVGDDYPGADFEIKTYFWEQKYQFKIYVWDKCRQTAVTDTEVLELYIYYENLELDGDASYHKKLGTNVTPPNI